MPTRVFPQQSPLPVGSAALCFVLVMLRGWWGEGEERWFPSWEFPVFSPSGNTPISKLTSLVKIKSCRLPFDASCYSERHVPSNTGLLICISHINLVIKLSQKILELLLLQIINFKNNQGTSQWPQNGHGFCCHYVQFYCPTFIAKQTPAGPCLGPLGIHVSSDIENNPSVLLSVGHYWKLFSKQTRPYTRIMRHFLLLLNWKWNLKGTFFSFSNEIFKAGHFQDSLVIYLIRGKTPNPNNTGKLPAGATQKQGRRTFQDSIVCSLWDDSGDSAQSNGGDWSVFWRQRLGKWSSSM